jgi:hypothetical protein
MSSNPRASLFRRWLALTPAERQLRREAWWTLLVSSIRLRLAPRGALARALRRSPPADSLSPMPDRAASGDTVAVAAAVASAAAHHAWTMRCLPRSLALLRMLDRRGVPAALRIGVRKRGEQVAAHAWVEVGGVALGEPEDVEKRFAPLLEIEKERERRA